MIIFYINFINNKIKAGAAAAPSEGDSLARLPYLRTWFRTRSAICLWLSNGSIQINWFEVCKNILRIIFDSDFSHMTKS